MRLIDADELARAFVRESGNADHMGQWIAYDEPFTLGHILNIIECQPTMNSLEQTLDYFEDCARVEPGDRDVQYIVIYLRSLVKRMRRRERRADDSERVPGANQAD